MKILIVGGGIYGLCAAWALKRAGHDITVFEQEHRDNPGSSHDQHRLIRYAYGEAPGYMRMVGDAYAAWDRVWRDLGVKLQVETGTLALGQAGTNWCAHSQALLEGDGHEVEVLDRKQLVERFPLVDPQGVEQAFYLKTGGALLADRVLKTLSGWLQGHGVRFIYARVLEADVHEARVKFKIEQLAPKIDVLDEPFDEYGDLVLVCAGPWTPRLVPELAPLVKPSRQVVAYLKPPREDLVAWIRHPMLLDIGDGTGFYLVPPVMAPPLGSWQGGPTGLKVGDHTFSLSGDPDADRYANWRDAEPILEQCAKRLRGFDRFELEQVKTCFYTVEEREHFIARPLDRRGWVLSCCSGHGFKFAPAIAEGFAAMLAGNISADHFTRWVGGESVKSPVVW